MYKPWYTVKIDVSGCGYDIRVNDCPVMADRDGRAVIVEMPVNQWILGGDNLLSAEAVRTPGDPGKCSAQVWVREFERGAGSMVAELSLVVPPAGDTGEPVLRRQAPFAAQIPFALWRWANVPPGEIGPDDREAVLQQAAGIWNAMAAGNLPLVQQYLLTKSDEICQSRYQTESMRQQELAMQFEDLFDHSQWELAPLDIGDAVLSPYGEKRLFKLTDEVTGDSPVFFISKDSTLATYMDLFFYKDHDALWRIIR